MFSVASGLKLLASRLRGPCPCCARRHGFPLCEDCASASRVAANPGTVDLSSGPLHYVGAYHRPDSRQQHGLSPLGRSLRSFKDAGDRYAGRCLASLFSERLAPLASGFDVIVPVPPNPDRLRRRGYNPATWLAAALARRSRLPLDTATLSHAHARRSQRGLDGEGRRANARGAFRLGRPAVEGYAVLLIDDVCTTGATLADAARCLAQAGVTRIECAVLACADEDLLISCPSRIADAGSNDTATPPR